VDGQTKGKILAGDSGSVLCDDECGVYALAEGLGSDAGKRAASRIFCDVASHYLPELSSALAGVPNDPEVRAAAIAMVQRVFDRAASQIHRMAGRRPGYGGMAATGALLVVGRAGAVLGHVGDTRAWLMHQQDLRQLTRDHTLEQSMRREGLVREDDHAFSPRSVLSRTIGHAPAVSADIIWLDVGPGDRLPLATASLHRWLDDRDLMRVVLRGARGRVGAGLIVEVGGGPEAVGGAAVESAAIGSLAKVACVQRMPIFQYLAESELLRLLKIVYELRLDPGHALCQEGDPGDAVWVVYSGRLDVTAAGHHLTTIQAGGHLGELAFMDGLPRSATVTAVEPTVVLAIGRDDFRGLIGNDPVLAAKVMWSFALNLGERLRALTVQVADRS
jgi:serine/threonine protein phosphatase PrpC